MNKLISSSQKRKLVQSTLPFKRPKHTEGTIENRDALVEKDRKILIENKNVLNECLELDECGVVKSYGKMNVHSVSLTSSISPSSVAPSSISPSSVSPSSISPSLVLLTATASTSSSPSPQVSSPPRTSSTTTATTTSSSSSPTTTTPPSTTATTTSSPITTTPPSTTTTTTTSSSSPTTSSSSSPTTTTTPPSTTTTTTATPLSPNVEEKRLAAKLKLMSTKTFGLVSNIGPTWFKALETEFTKPYFEKLSKFVREERSKHTVYPPLHQVFSWTQVVPIHEIKLVIVGQDPYHQPNQAHGLCFSVQKGVVIPPSLKNMYKELEQSFESFKNPGHGYLLGWAQQGILLLNSVLTVRRNEANSHKDAGWEQLTDAVMNWLNANLHGIVFMLWGSYAHKKGDRINKNKHHVLKGVHPSPLSAHRGFFGCGHFKSCNEFLKKQGKGEIDWGRLP